MPKFTVEDSNRPECCGRLMNRGQKAQSGRQRYICRICKRSTTNSGDTNSDHETYGYDVKAAEKRWTYLKGRVKEGCKIVVTCAQNNTRVHHKQLKTLLKYCEHNGAELIVIPMHHKNISLFGNKGYKKEWAGVIQPYLIDRPLKIGCVDIRADIKIQATMFNPLAGKEPISGHRWAIFGHPQFALQTVPAVKDPKRMYTSGSITVRNYSRTNAGAKAEFHHVQGALVIETKGRKTFVRHLNSESGGGFYDLDAYYTPTKIKKDQAVLGIFPGDEHAEQICPKVKKATYGPGGMVETLMPKFIIRSDVLGGYAGSHHHEKNDVLQYRKSKLGLNDYRKELDNVVAFLNETTPDYATNIIQASNHHDHLYQWLSRVDPKKDHTNAELIHELKLLQYKNATKGKVYDPHDSDPFRLYAESWLTCDAIFLRRTQHYFIAGIDVSQHGDVGPNGSRGSARALSRASHKMMIGHSHSACIIRGVYQVGKSTGRQEYERGLSSSTQTHGIIYPNGKRALIDIFGEDWRA